MKITATEDLSDKRATLAEGTANFIFVDGQPPATN
jgi:hypothetical protein